jgi:hypothetical protein
MTLFFLILINLKRQSAVETIAKRYPCFGKKLKNGAGEM